MRPSTHDPAGTPRHAHGRRRRPDASALTLARHLDPDAALGAWRLTSPDGEETTLAGVALPWTRRVVWGQSVLYGDALYSNAPAWQTAIVWGETFIWGDTLIWGETFIWGENVVESTSFIWGEAIVWGDDLVTIDGQLFVWGDAYIWGELFIWGDSAACTPAGCTPQPLIPARAASMFHRGRREPHERGRVGNGPARA
jgi:hypothetical protein